MEAVNFAGWFALGVIPKPNFKPVGVIDQRTPAILRLEAVGVEFGLPLAANGINGGFFSFDHSQRAISFATFSPEYVVDETFA